MNRAGFRSDAEGCGRIVLEILLRRKPKVWRNVLLTVEDEADYVAWLSRWAFHWAAKHLNILNMNNA